MFTCSQILEIREKLAGSGVPVSSLPLAESLKGNELIHLIQNGKDVVTTLRSIIDKAIAWNVTDFINLSRDGNSYTLQEVIESVPEINKKQGQVITFINRDTDTWVTYQFLGMSVDEWYNIELWESIYDDAHFKGWYLNECMLNKHHPNPIVGDYAYIGNTCENSLIYMCITNGEWYNTGKYVSGINESGTGVANISFTDTFSNIKTKAVNGELVAGAIYTITDYRCSLIVPEANIEHLSDRVGWNITLLAVNDHEFGEDAVITIQPDGNYKGNKIVECKYSIYKEGFNWTKDVDDSSFYGVIYHMKDEFGNQAPYDFKNIVFARYKVLDIAANTTPSNASLIGPFRCFGLEGATRSNPDYWVGTGHTFEKTLVPAIFNGTFTEITGTYLDNLGLFQLDDEYIQYMHKPFNWFKWVSWKPTTQDLYTELSEGEYRPLHYVTVDSSSADKMKLVYTFSIVDKEGNVREGSSDTSYYSSSNSNTYRFYRNEIIGKSVASDILDGIYLPNVVILLYDKNSSGYEGICKNNSISGINSTILVTPYSAPQVPSYSFIRNLIGDGKLSGITRTILCGTLIYDNIIGTILRSYVAADLVRNFWNVLFRNVLFGCFFNTNINNMAQDNLLYGLRQHVKVKGETSWKAVNTVRGGDAHFWYLDIIEGVFYCNIMNAFKYSKFWPHVGINTITNSYNNNVELRGYFCLNFAKGLNWHTKVDYGCVGHIFNHIENSNLDPLCFKTTTLANGNKWYKISELYTIPSFRGLDIKGSGILPLKFVEFIGNNPSLENWSGFGFNYVNRALVTKDSADNIKLKYWSSL